MIRPTKRTLQVMQLYNKEVIESGLMGAQTRTAKLLRLSRQCVEQYVRRFPQLILKVNEIEYLKCKICDCEVPKDLIKRNTCRDCREQKLRHCPQCNVVYRPEKPSECKRQICKDCATEIHNVWQQNNKEHLRKKYGTRSAYYKRYQKKYVKKSKRKEKREQYIKEWKEKRRLRKLQKQNVL